MDALVFPEIEHDYGPRIHILRDPYLELGLTRLSSPACRQPELHYWIGRLYRELLGRAVAQSFATSEIQVPTRMAAMHPEAVVRARVADPQSRVVVVNLARAGSVPSHVCYDELNHFFVPENIRQDYLLMNRSTNASGQVTGSASFGEKIGGSIDDAYVLVPDPMGATGSTLCEAARHYSRYGRARRWIALHLIITPEYIRTVQSQMPELEVYALRLDRGFSSARALAARPGQHPAEEKGLNEKQYIVPGAGGLGEILNNAFI